jgi:hypothetical protein
MKEKRLLSECSQTIKIQDYNLVIKHNAEGISLDIYKQFPLDDILLIEKTWWFEDLSELAFNQE